MPNHDDDLFETTATFTARVLVGVGCWLWVGYRQRDGYGLVRKKGRSAQAAHRVAYRLFVGPIPPGLVVMHSCDTPACVRPSHLTVGTQAQNMADMWAKGRGRKPGTHCRRGHPFDVIDKTGQQRCRICVRAAQTRHNQKRRTAHAR